MDETEGALERQLTEAEERLCEVKGQVRGAEIALQQRVEQLADMPADERLDAAEEAAALRGTLKMLRETLSVLEGRARNALLALLQHRYNAAREVAKTVARAQAELRRRTTENARARRVLMNNGAGDMTPEEYDRKRDGLEKEAVTLSTRARGLYREHAAAARARDRARKALEDAEGAS